MIAVMARCDGCGTIAPIPHAGPTSVPMDTLPPLGWLILWQRYSPQPDIVPPDRRLIACSIDCARTLLERQ